MASGGKALFSKLKKFVWMAITFVVAWACTKALDTYFNTTLLSSLSSSLSLAWQDLKQDIFVPVWTVFAVNLCIAAASGVAIFYYIEARKAYKQLEETERRAALSNSTPVLTDMQTKIMWCFAYFTNNQLFIDGGLILGYTRISTLELDVTIEELVSQGLLHLVSYNTVTGGHQPRLTAKGKKCALAIYSKNPNMLGPSLPKPKVADLS